MKELQGIEIKESSRRSWSSNCPSENSDKTAEFNKVIKNARKWRNG